jgi:uncharacterized membrane protein YdjX (TVP38/TMEM64 family)
MLEETAVEQPTKSHFRSPIRLMVALLIVFLIVTSWSWQSEGIVFDLARTDQTAAWKVEQLQQFFEACGPLAPIVYVAFVTIEVVVAPIPGLMLYAPGGVVFGGFVGGLLSLIGNVFGAGIACGITRNIGSTWLTRLFPEDSLEKAQTELDRRGSWLIFLLRVNPLTSSDLVSYAAGFTRISIGKVMLATMFGMAPLCFAQAWLAESLFVAYPWLLYPLLAAGLVYVIAIVVVIRRLAARNETKLSENDNVSGGADS